MSQDSVFSRLLTIDTDDEASKQRVRLFQIVILTLAGISAAGAIASLFAEGVPAATRSLLLLQLLPASLIALLCLLLLQRGRLLLVAHTLFLALNISVLLAMLVQPALPFLPFLLLISVISLALVHNVAVSMVYFVVFVGGTAVSMMVDGGSQGVPFLLTALGLATSAWIFAYNLQQEQRGISARALMLSRETDDLQRRLRQLRVSAEVGRVASASLDVSEIYRRSMGALIEQFDLARASLSSWNPDDRTLALEIEFVKGSDGKIVQNYSIRQQVYPLARFPLRRQAVEEQQAIVYQSNQEVQEPAQQAVLEQLAHQRVLMLPLLAGERVLGLIELYRNGDQPNFRPDISLIQTVSTQIATALSNAQLATEARTQAAQMSTINRVSRALSEAPDLPSIYASIRHEIFSLTNATGLSILLLSEDEKHLRWVYAYEYGEELSLTDSLLPISRGFSGYVARTRHVLWINEKFEEMRQQFDSFTVGTAAKAWLGVPLIVANQLIGVLAVENGHDPQAFTKADVQLLSTIAGPVATAMNNLRLLQEAQEALRFQSEQSLLLRTGAEVSAATSSILDVNQLMQRSVELIQERFGLYDVGLFLIEETTNEAVLQAGAGAARQGPAAPDLRIPVGSHSILGKVIADGQARIVEAVSQHEAPLLPETQSALILPLKVRNEIIGALTVQSTEPDAFPRGLMGTLQTMSEQLAIAIDNVRLFQETQRNIEEIQEANERLRELDRVKTQFLASMSHELRTPLNSIIGFSRVILKGIDGPINETQRTDLTAIYESGQHLLMLINDILDLAKIESGKMTLVFQSVDLGASADSVLATLRGLVKDKPIALCCEIAESLPPIEADPVRLRQIMLNLLSNAAKYTQEGTITFRIYQEDPAQVRLEVSDTGIGIAEEDYDKLFTSFEQLNASPTRALEGTGLGMAITQSLVQMHHGDIWLESTLGEGTTFFVRLPLKQPDDTTEIPVRTPFSSPQ